MKKMTAFLVTLCMLAALLAGCGGASKSTQAFDAAAPAAAAPAEAANGAYYDMESAKSEDGGLTGDTAADSAALPEGWKVFLQKSNCKYRVPFLTEIRSDLYYEYRIFGP